MITFFEYISLNEVRGVVSAEMRYDCERELEDIILNYARHIKYGVLDDEKENEFYSKFDSNLRKCIDLYAKRKYNSLFHRQVLDRDDLINKTLYRVWKSIPSMLEQNRMNFSVVMGLIKKMIERAIIDMIKSINTRNRKLELKKDTIGTDLEPRSLADDPSENINIEEILSTPDLTYREKFVLRKKWEGAMGKDIADELGVGPTYVVALQKDAIKKVKRHFGF